MGRSAPTLTTAVFFGSLIAVVLIGSQALAVWWWPVQSFDGVVAAVGAVFLAAGLAAGWRLRSGLAGRRIALSTYGKGGS